MGGGCVRSMLGIVARAGLDHALRQAWAGGVGHVRAERRLAVLVRAGADRVPRGAGLPVAGLGLLMGSNAVHYDKEPRRRPDFQAAIAAGMAPGWAADDGAALHFVGRGLSRVVTSRPKRGRLPRGARWAAKRGDAAGDGVPGGAGRPLVA